MLTDRTTLLRLDELHQRDGIPHAEGIAIGVALLHSMTGDGRRAAAAAMLDGDDERRRLVGVHATRGVVHAWHGLLGQPDWRAAYDSRRTRE